VTRAHLARVFWIGAAALLALAALIALVALLRGRFTDTDGQILATLAILFLAGSTGIAGIALEEREEVHPLGLIATGVAAVSFLVGVVFIWRNFEGDTFVSQIAGTGLVVTLGALLVTSGRLLLKERRLTPLWLGMCSAFGVCGAILVAAIWGAEGGDAAGKAAAAAGILGGLGWFLVPVLQRLAQTSPTAGPDRVLVTFDGVEAVATRHPEPDSVEISLEHGERLVLRRVADGRAGANAAPTGP
jgi:hypothetical protein